ncbi:uncharacterized protein J4E87_008505 [Alternaria ethzedia]|uniref:uncharacterized protein n=1 Tax=Alternaria ethzedia TaxID=181014 RepID=UPI0020C361BE|nr:uncharacterized protein J4E87_008505 [Alternaria ethzedia]KAI4616993.1 hypothetical protein J4E87_008505 [Alternaria ethzedia]
MELGIIPTSPVGNEYYEVRAIPGKGYGCVSLKPIPRGTRILAEDPLLIVPVGDYMLSDVQKAFDSLTPSQQTLYYTLHSSHGQDPNKWPSRIHESVPPQEVLRIKEQHKARTDPSPSLISIFQTNCMEMNAGAAVFPHAARFNHSCNPNACFSWNASIGKETIHVMNPIAAGEEITLSYCDMIHDKSLRVYELKHYGFTCDCPACSDDEEDETSYGYQSAERRFRLQELERETRFFRGANLEKGAQRDDFVKKLLQLAALHKAEGDYTARLANLFLDIALVCELRGDLGMAELTAGKAVEVKRDCQGADFPNYSRYTDVLHRIKSKVALKG